MTLTSRMKIEFDVLAPSFREAKERWPDAPTLSAHYEALHQCYTNNSFALIETVKSFVECICRTILADIGESAGISDPTTTRLLNATLRYLGLENSRGVSKLDKALSAYNRLADALSELRNESGPVAHGKDGFLDNLSSRNLHAVLIIGDSLIGLLLSALEGKEPDLRHTREPYERFDLFNQRIDRSVVVETNVQEDGGYIISIVIKAGPKGNAESIPLFVEPSRLLYNLDRTAYMEILSIANIAIEDNMKEGVTEEEFEEVAPEGMISEFEEPSPEKTAPIVGHEATYQGGLSHLRPKLEARLAEFRFSLQDSDRGGDNLVEALLAATETNTGLAWKERDALQARLRVSLRRTLIRFGLGAEAARKTSGELVEWLKSELSDPTEGKGHV